MPRAPALQPSLPTGADEGGWEEEEEEGERQNFGQPSGQAKGATGISPAGQSPSALSFGCVSPNVLFRAPELPFNSSRKQLRNLCFF